MSERDDEALMQAVARDRDQGAFGELVSRFERPALGVAYRITGRRELAEEAVQEAMLHVWISAPSYQPEGKVDAWIMRIVARESLMALRVVRKAVRMQKGATLSHMDRDHQEMSVVLEGQELVTACWKLFESLPFRDQQILALHYGGGLSQVEISKELAIPQRTISGSIQRTLETLRAGLTRAGFGAGVPLLGTAELFQALTSGVEVPPGLREKVLERMSQAARESLRASRPILVKRSLGQGLLFPVALALAAVAAGAFWWAAGSNPIAPKTLASAPADPPNALPPPTPESSQAKTYFRRWDFNSPEQAQDFKVIRGSWHHVPGGGSDGTGCMEIEAGGFTYTVDVSESNLPILLTFRSCPMQHDSKIGLLWERHQGVGCFRNIGREAFVPPLSWITVRVYATEHSLDCWIDQERFLLLAVNPIPGSRLGIGISGRRRIDDFTIQTIGSNEVKDVSACLSAVEKIEPARRVGTVMLPGLKGADRSRPVSVDFFGKSAEAAGTEP